MLAKAPINCSFETEYWEDNFCRCLITDGTINKIVYLPEACCVDRAIVVINKVNYWILTFDKAERMTFNTFSWQENLVGINQI